MPAWESAGLPVERVSLVAAAAMAGLILDIRQTNEFEAGHVPGAHHVELAALTDAVDEFDNEGITVMCGHGERAMTGASLLARAGRQGVVVALGGPGDWAAAHHLTLQTGR